MSSVVDDEWSLLGSGFGVDDGSWTDSWSFVTDDNDNDTSDTSVATKGSGVADQHSSPVGLSVIDEKEQKVDYIFNQLDLDDYQQCKNNRRRFGKKALKHSLVKRCQDCVPNDAVVEADRPKDKDGFCPKTAIDDALPELLQPCTSYMWTRQKSDASLRHAGRWDKILALFAELEECGEAVRVPKPNDRRYKIDDGYGGRYSCPPRASMYYLVRPNGQTHITRRVNSSYHSYTSARKMYHWHQGKLAVKYETSTGHPPTKVGLNQPLKAQLRAAPGSKTLEGASRRAFVPGIYGFSNYGASDCVSSMQNRHVQKAADLVFGRPVLVSYASIAGKIHDSTLHELNVRREIFSRRARAAGRSTVYKTKVNVAVEGTDAYVERVQILARLTTNPREWVSLGVFDGSRDCHTEKAIYLGDSPGAMENKKAVPCVALRFCPVSWHNQPAFRVGAYGVDPTSSSQQSSPKDNVVVTDPFEGWVSYAVRCFKPTRSDGDCEEEVIDKNSTWRRYAVKQGVSGEKRWYGTKPTKAKKRSSLRNSILDASKT